VAEGLVYLHSLQIIHGDIKEVGKHDIQVMYILLSDLYNAQENILIDQQGHVHLADFGLAIAGEATEGRMSTTLSNSGTIRFMSPQRFQGARRCKADDVYAFGCVTYTV
jgi:serine/threonine protein kinase